MGKVSVIIICCFNLFVVNIEGLFEFNAYNGPALSSATIFKLQKIDPAKLQNAFTLAVEHFNKSIRFESTISQSRIKVKKGGISHAQLLDGLPSDLAKEYDKVAQVILKTSLFFLLSESNSLNIDKKEFAQYLSGVDLPESSLKGMCLLLNRQKDVQKSGYHPYRRLLPAEYKDGLYKIRTNSDGSDLPLPRVITNKFYDTAVAALNALGPILPISQEGVIDTQRNIMLIQWSQFLEQDIAKTVVQSMRIGNPIECCDSEYQTALPRYRLPACTPLLIPDNDNFYSRYLVRCLNYVRSALAINPDCKLGPANQLNQATNSWDLSQLYGIDENTTNTMRSFHHGQLRTSVDLESPVLTKISGDSHLCHSPNETCYISGDTRVNANPYMILQHIIFMRSHNKIAKELKALNQRWNDGQLFAAARKINIALYQKIIYEEWTKVVLGVNVAERINDEDIVVQKRDYGVSNEFATVGIRFYNTMMPGDLSSSQSYSIEGTTTSDHDDVFDTNTASNRLNIFKLQDTFYRPNDHFTKREYILKILKGSLHQKAMAMDTSYVDDLTMHLYRTSNTEFGTDSLALDIMRGRDHGLQGYINYVKACRQTEINNWDDLRGIIFERDIKLLREIYKNVEAIDLIMGAIAEIPSEGATVGPTLICIIGEQLSNSRIMDSHFYTKPKNEKVARTVAGYSGARLLCDTTNIDAVPRNIFEVPSPDKNPLISCSDTKSLPQLKLHVWREN